MRWIYSFHFASSVKKTEKFTNKKGECKRRVSVNCTCTTCGKPNWRRYSLTQMYRDISRDGVRKRTHSNIISSGTIEIIIIVVVVLWTSTNRRHFPSWTHHHALVSHAFDGYVTLYYIFIIMVEHNSNNSGKICEWNQYEKKRKRRKMDALQWELFRFPSIVGDGAVHGGCWFSGKTLSAIDTTVGCACVYRQRLDVILLLQK